MLTLPGLVPQLTTPVPSDFRLSNLLACLAGLHQPNLVCTLTVTELEVPEGLDHRSSAMCTLTHQRGSASG